MCRLHLEAVNVWSLLRFLKAGGQQVWQSSQSSSKSFLSRSNALFHTIKTQNKGFQAPNRLQRNRARTHIQTSHNPQYAHFSSTAELSTKSSVLREACYLLTRPCQPDLHKLNARRESVLFREEPNLS